MCPINAIIDPIYMPAMRQIIAITQEIVALVTTSFPHGYKDGNIVRIYIPHGFGMWQIDQQFGSIVIASPISFYISIDTRTYDAFVVPVNSDQIAQVVPIGEDAALLTNAIQNVLV